MRLLTEAGLEPGDRRRRCVRAAQRVRGQLSRCHVRRRRLVNIGHEVTNINILDNGVPILTRDIAVGTRRFREDLQRERGLAAEEAEQLLQGYDRSPHLERCIESRGEEIAVGIERAAAFLASSSRSAGKLERSYTCGGGARVPGLTEALADAPATSGRAGQPARQRSRVRDGALESLVTDEVAPLLMLPIGLALRQVA